MDGLRCARQVRELQTRGSLIRHVTIIAVTANARKEQIESTVAAGMDDFMPKLFRVPDLLPKTEKLRAPEQWRRPSVRRL
ncbi:hypothetical protein ABVK25_010861 [Lepraria finkii]|uniref:Response regulatory domain-containing protein n=1 Tax=Lepraria finkii TaxID=1340010 RepID=A0ABR4ATN3_9LECA